MRIAGLFNKSPSFIYWEEKCTNVQRLANSWVFHVSYHLQIAMVRWISRQQPMKAHEWESNKLSHIQNIDISTNCMSLVTILWYIVYSLHSLMAGRSTPGELKNHLDSQSRLCRWLTWVEFCAVTMATGISTITSLVSQLSSAAVQPVNVSTLEKGVVRPFKKKN